MAKAPKLLLRESCIQEISKAWQPANFLELGAGTGYMTRLFLDRSFKGTCYDLGENSRTLLRKNLSGYFNKVNIVDDICTLTKNSFDYLFAFEVLEHIENDLEELAHWTSFLKPEGKILISVPAHKRKFSKTDRMVGHIRRYEKSELHQLLEKSGYKEINIINYGFPITELSRMIGNLLLNFDQTDTAQLSTIERSTQSSYTRPNHIRKCLSLVNDNLFLPFCLIQRLFYRYDLGDGYIAFARKA